MCASHDRVRILLCMLHVWWNLQLNPSQLISRLQEVLYMVWSSAIGEA